jgi:hypothetical protein
LPLGWLIGSLAVRLKVGLSDRTYLRVIAPGDTLQFREHLAQGDEVRDIRYAIARRNSRAAAIGCKRYYRPPR